MEKIDFYVASELCRILNMDTGLYDGDILYRFYIISGDDGYHLYLVNADNLIRIPDSTVQRIVQDTAKDPKSILFHINKNLKPLKDFMIQKAMPPSCQRIDWLLSMARGYAIKDNNILFFFDPGSLQMNLFKSKQETSFCLAGHLYKTAADENIYRGMPVFMAYYKDGRILKFDTQYENDAFVIRSVSTVPDMEYKTMYQQNKPTTSIYNVYSNKKRGLFSKILIK